MHTSLPELPPASLTRGNVPPFPSGPLTPAQAQGGRGRLAADQHGRLLHCEASVKEDDHSHMPIEVCVTMSKTKSISSRSTWGRGKYSVQQENDTSRSSRRQHPLNSQEMKVSLFVGMVETALCESPQPRKGSVPGSITKLSVGSLPRNLMLAHQKSSGLDP